MSIETNRRRLRSLCRINIPPKWLDYVYENFSGQEFEEISIYFVRDHKKITYDSVRLSHKIYQITGILFFPLIERFYPYYRDAGEATWTMHGANRVFDVWSSEQVKRLIKNDVKLDYHFFNQSYEVFEI